MTRANPDQTDCRPFEILIADDDPLSLRMIEVSLRNEWPRIVSARDGEEAWRILQGETPPRLAILDWMMPSLEGPEICRRLRRLERQPYVYVVLLTSREDQEDLIAGLEAGADDYVVKPFDPAELKCRVRVGERILRLQSSLGEKVAELEDALAHVRRLQGLLPICVHCKSIRDDENTWHRLEAYLEEHSEILFTHSLCRKCLVEHYPDYAEEGVGCEDQAPSQPG